MQHNASTMAVSMVRIINIRKLKEISEPWHQATLAYTRFLSMYFLYQRGSPKFERNPIKKNQTFVIVVVAINQTRVGNSVTYLGCSLPFALYIEITEISILPKEIFQKYMHPKYNYCKDVSIQPLCDTNYIPSSVTIN